MGWMPEVDNDRADEDAARAATLTLHDADPGDTGANQVLTAALSWSPGGTAGPVPALQPARAGVAYAAPTVAVPESTLTFYGFRDSGGAWLGGFPISPPMETVTLSNRQLLVRTGPNV